MSLETPIKIRMLQRKLYQKAKEEPDYRFYLLYDKIYREDILNHAYALAKSNQGALGVTRKGAQCAPKPPSTTRATSASAESVAKYLPNTPTPEQSLLPANVPSSTK